MQRWFISDTHFGHSNIIKYCDRPFSNAREMDEFILTRWNELVKPEDHISHLGDVTMERGGRVQKEAFIKRMRGLNGHKRLYLGNHDHWPVEVYLAAGFEKIYGTWRDEQGILYSHIPIHPSNLGSARANIHGHIHQNESPPPYLFEREDGTMRCVPYINISVEVTGYLPLTFEQVMERVNKVKEAHGAGEYKGKRDKDE